MRKKIPFGTWQRLRNPYQMAVASFMQAGILWNALLDEAESKGSHFVRKWVNSVWL